MTPTRQDVIEVVEAYLKGVGSRDLTAAPLHPDVEYEVAGQWIKGATILRGFLGTLLPMINHVTVVRHIVDGEWCATAFTLDTTYGTISACDCFHVVNGQIVSIHVYYDSRAILSGANRLAS